ncbi:hypothetical protein [Dactylosporangium darangshiense]|uniref:Transposase n=1 Tax=Dactylosporangium darangshiense TaxID=579108 RepID=A0ABP8DUP9_9ACTN
MSAYEFNAYSQVQLKVHSVVQMDDGTSEGLSCRRFNAPELNPTETVWSSLKRSMANLAPGSIKDLA